MRINSINNNNICRNKAQKSPSFKANIFFVDGQTFNRKLKELSGVFHVSGLIDGVIEQAAVKKESAYTKGIRVCTSCITINPEKMLLNMEHLSPKGKTLPNIDEVKNTIFNQAKDLKGETNRNLQGLILGSDGNNMQDLFPLSISLREELCLVFNKISKNLGMDFSVIAGRLNPYTKMNVISDSVRNAHYIWVQGLNSTSMQEVAKNYKTKIISPKDKVFFNNLDCTNEFAQTRTFSI